VYNDSEERKIGADGGYTYYSYQKLTYRTTPEGAAENTPSDWDPDNFKDHSLWGNYYVFQDGQPGTILKNLKYLWERYPFKVYRVKDFSDNPSDWKLAYSQTGWPLMLK
jgi:hypothetical protein